MKRPKKCPNCQGEMITKEVGKILKGGVNTAIIQVEAEVCLSCGERLYNPYVVRQFAQIRAKLKNQETKDFELIGQSFSVRSR
jgi:YgiT-type zinc finger domain-containing protein